MNRDGYEIDLVLERRGGLEAIEIKLTTNPSLDDLDRLGKAADLPGAPRRVLISRTEKSVDDGTRLSCSLNKYLESLSASQP